MYFANISAWVIARVGEDVVLCEEAIARLYPPGTRPRTERQHERACVRVNAAAVADRRFGESSTTPCGCWLSWTCARPATPSPSLAGCGRFGGACDVARLPQVWARQEDVTDLSLRHVTSTVEPGATTSPGAGD